jgi:hypothetical protein
MVLPAPGYSGKFGDGPGPLDYNAQQPKLNGRALDWSRCGETVALAGVCVDGFGHTFVL